MDTVNKGLHAPSLAEADQGAQILDQELAFMVWQKAFAGCIHQRLQFLSAWTALPNLADPHDDQRSITGTEGQSSTIFRAKVKI
ncbi:hypothetical protein IC232_20180 [Microvirga sp. BT688]|uniref:hypothetical protein n=1 Tax=Microvirga sp. TaxID=1873136 RepID=UPI00168663C5|nr:hypothetical protein [Microvirga sp.]MBD2749011.1 hypothetical protein [Microvirga sp.]